MEDPFQVLKNILTLSQQASTLIKTAINSYIKQKNPVTVA